MSYWFRELILLFSRGRVLVPDARTASKEIPLIKPDVRIGSQLNKSAAANVRTKVLSKTEFNGRTEADFQCTPDAIWSGDQFALIEAAVAAAAFSTPGLAQADIEDPGYCAEFYLNEKCQNLGSGKRYTDGVYYHNDPAQTNEPNAYHYHPGPKSND